ncbi:cytochrome-c peroxidase [Aureibacter tunicatorum]|uniref:Cytochrome c peroxidase n=1 Tax=Aureibacter tunicatorum TaxID=866807 RepID=A0AAE3XNY0_9BACT|nr:cytochrome c peroxidase [Aureibacter tunicatorum]MDR6239438.1 cytochrome c peroxidase [Aureibacter tunicatorum]BDD04639.1 cytochrome-c peroxidase [Aureibacter tunicatorum]
MIKKYAIIFFILGLCSCNDITDEQSQVLEFSPPAYFGDFVIPEDNQMTSERVALGRMLFYEQRLSKDENISCASCHIQEFAFADTARFSTGVNGQKGMRNSMSLANMLWNVKFFWDGRANSLEHQVHFPIEDPLEMGQSMQAVVEKLNSLSEYKEPLFKAYGLSSFTEEAVFNAIAQFERTLISSNSKYDKYLRNEMQLTAQEKYGMDLFFTHPEPRISLEGGNCGDCHMNILTAGVNNDFEGFHNNGLDDDENLKEGLFKVTSKQRDFGKFKAPTLRNIALTAPYMHDGRFNTLEEVLDHYNEHVKMNRNLDRLIIEASNVVMNPDTVTQVQLHLNKEQKEAIIAFLNTLTDVDFINNPEYANPFK